MKVLLILIIAFTLTGCTYKLDIHDNNIGVEFSPNIQQPQDQIEI